MRYDNNVGPVCFCPLLDKTFRFDSYALNKNMQIHAVGRPRPSIGRVNKKTYKK